MKQRGRKSSAAVLAGVASLDLVRAEKRPDPPAELTEYQANLWREIVNTKPSDWFRPDTFQLLIGYCRHASAAAILDQQIEAFDPEWLKDSDGLTRYDKLLHMRERETRALTALSRSMRMNQQAVYHKETAGSRSAKVTKAKPWAK